MDDRLIKRRTILHMVEAMCRYVGSLDEDAPSRDPTEVTISLANAKNALKELKLCAEKQLGHHPTLADVSNTGVAHAAER